MKLDSKVRQLLDESGLPWEIVNGAKHYKLMVQGRMAAILPHGGNSYKWDMVRAAVRRAVRQSASTGGQLHRPPGPSGA